MEIIVASTNKAKIQAVKNVFGNMDILNCSSKSNVSSKPINDDTILGAYNRVNNINGEADMIISLEGGYFIINQNYYIADICCIKTKDGYRFGNSDLFTISPNMFECIKNGYSLNSIIKEIIGYPEDKSEFKQNSGIVGYLSNGKYDRSFGNTQAVRNAENAPIINFIEEFKPKFKAIVDLKGYNYNLLDKKCENIIGKEPFDFHNF